MNIQDKFRLFKTSLSRNIKIRNLWLYYFDGIFVELIQSQTNTDIQAHDLRITAVDMTFQKENFFVFYPRLTRCPPYQTSTNTHAIRSRNKQTHKLGAHVTRPNDLRLSFRKKCPWCNVIMIHLRGWVYGFSVYSSRFFFGNHGNAMG